MRNTLQCRVCGNGVAKSIGRIPDCGEFAGQSISPSIKGGMLWCCTDCGSLFRYPTLTADDYISLYEIAPSTVWGGGETDRNDFSIIYQYLAEHHGGAILDVGCFAGNFLEGLPNKFKKYGIEPSLSASQRAGSKGVNIIGKTLTELDSSKTFDVVVAIDVIEHVLNVEEFLTCALDTVGENGLLIISTGNPDSPFWKSVFKAKYWYNVIPEHVTFPSYEYYCRFAQKHGLPAPEQIRFRYGNAPAKFLGLLRQAVYASSPALYGFLRRCQHILLGGNKPFTKDVVVNAMGIFADHHVIVFHKQVNLCWRKT